MNHTLMAFLLARIEEDMLDANLWRELLIEHAEYGGYCGTCQDMQLGDPQRWPCRTVRLMAAEYDDHPDYRAKWRP